MPDVDQSYLSWGDSKRPILNQNYTSRPPPQIKLPGGKKGGGGGGNFYLKSLAAKFARTCNIEFPVTCVMSY